MDSFFKKRPSIADVKERGIVKAGNVFGADLEKLVENDAARMMSLTYVKENMSRQHLVPTFVSNCVFALGEMMVVSSSERLLLSRSVRTAQRVIDES